MSRERGLFNNIQTLFIKKTSEIKSNKVVSKNKKK